MPDYAARRLPHWQAVPERWHALARGGGATPFQTPTFLDAWYRTVGAGTTPVIVEVSAANGEPAALFPLALRRRGPLRTIGFADAGVADNIAPILGPSAPREAAGAEALWRAVAAVLPRADLVRFDKIALEVGERANPLARIGRQKRSQLESRAFVLPDSWEGYVRSRSKHFRKEQARIWRVFQRAAADARFALVEDPHEALRVFDALERLQSARMREIGVPYRLDEARHRAFYRRLVADGIPAGDVVLGALLAGEEVVGALLGLCNGHSVTMVRIGHAGGVWRAASPGRLVIERTVEALHARGIRHVDLSIGDYGYKDDFGVVAGPLQRLTAPLGPLGWPAALAEATKDRLRGSALLAPIRRLRAARFAPRPAKA